MTAVAKDTPLGSQQVAIIRPGRGLFDLDLGAVWRYRELLFVLIKRDIQVLYKQAALGAGWAIIQPLFAVAIFTIVFGMFAKMPSDGVPYPIFAFAGVLPWTYFAEATRRASTGLVDDAELIRKVYFPRLIMPLAKVTAPLLDFCISCVVMIGLMLAYGIVPSFKIILIFPLVLVATLLALAIALWLGPINVRFRDIKHTVPFMLQVWMYASPIVYPLSQVPAEYKVLYSLNPMVGVIEGFRWALLDKGHPDLSAMAIGAVVIVALLAGGLLFFKHMERFFADVM
jgi:lipopolysaccharide transport system permease protein